MSGCGLQHAATMTGNGDGVFFVVDRAAGASSVAQAWQDLSGDVTLAWRVVRSRAHLGAVETV